jgi:hypothetical protein
MLQELAKHNTRNADPVLKVIVQFDTVLQPHFHDFFKLSRASPIPYERRVADSITKNVLSNSRVFA